MGELKYIKLSEINPNDFIPLLNNQKTREHLIDHEYFDTDNINAWIKTKIEVNSTVGCKVRAIIFKNQLIGWCGIQLENGQYEVAIVIDSNYWGIGKNIFYEIMRWAKVLGHEELFIHFLHTRPEYKFLRKISTKVYESELLGSKFTTYQLAVK